MTLDRYIYFLFGTVFITLIWLIFVVAKSENYKNGYRQGYIDGKNSMPNYVETYKFK